MTVSQVAKIDSLTIPSGATVSNSLSANGDYGDAAGLGLISPATLDAGTYKWQVSHDNSTWADYQVGNPLADEIIPAISNATVYYGLLVFPYIRLSGPTAAADRTFIVTKSYTSP